MLTPIPAGNVGSIVLINPLCMRRSVSTEISACSVALRCRLPDHWPVMARRQPPITALADPSLPPITGLPNLPGPAPMFPATISRFSNPDSPCHPACRWQPRPRQLDGQFGSSNSPLAPAPWHCLMPSGQCQGAPWATPVFPLVNVRVPGWHCPRAAPFPLTS